MRRRSLLALLISSVLLTACGASTQETHSIEGTPVPELQTINGNTIEKVDIEYKDIIVYDETVPAYSSEPYYELRNGDPWFSDMDYTTEEFETYSDLDELGRCGVAYANISTYSMPDVERGAIGQIKPSGWHTVKYDCVEGKYLYNRCHLIGFQLAGENANELNLITGTRYLNIDGMLEHENMIANYIEDTGNHVLYRVTPFYTGDNLVADGVLMEAYSVEDNGAGIEFCIFAYNVQPGIDIDYKTGKSKLIGDSTEKEEKKYTENKDGIIYILNTDSKKYHLETCTYAEKISEENKETFNGTIEWLNDNGYKPCGVCKP